MAASLLFTDQGFKSAHFEIGELVSRLGEKIREDLGHQILLLKSDFLTARLIDVEDCVPLRRISSLRE